LAAALPGTTDVFAVSVVVGAIVVDVVDEPDCGIAAAAVADEVVPVPVVPTVAVARSWSPPPPHAVNPAARKTARKKRFTRDFTHASLGKRTALPCALLFLLVQAPRAISHDRVGSDLDILQGVP
jgi:hypothetical protein